MPTREDLMQRRALPLGAKVLMSQNRIREWYEHFQGQVCVSFSGGKDSTALLHLVRDLYPNVRAVFVNTGLEFPEVQSFARKMGAEFVRPKMRFDEVISKYGYPIISKEVSGHGAAARALLGKNKCNKGACRDGFLGKREYDFSHKEKWLPLIRDAKFRVSDRCCYVMKKSPATLYQKKNKLYPYLGTLTEESLLRESAWLKNGCNAFDAKKKVSTPLAFWREQDILRYIKDNGLEIASVYGDIVCVDGQGFEYEPMPGVDCALKCSGAFRTGCIFCAYGVHLEKGETRFQRLAKTHPKQYEYCLGGAMVRQPEL